MGGFASRRNSGVQTVDIQNENAYRYPPKSGSYFGSYFMMGGERFDMTPPEAYLFGDNSDLNFLGSKPIPFPYNVTQNNEPTKTLKSLVYIRKDSLKFVKTVNAEKPPPEDDQEEQQPIPTRYNIEFTFDADANCAITIYYFAREETSNWQIVYRPSTGLRSETYHYKRGANQTFSQPAHTICPSDYNEADWQYTFEKEIIPISIHCVVEEEDYIGHSHVTYAVVEKSSDGGFMLKPLKQKQFVDGLSYLLQEIYGIENKNVDREKIDPDDEPDDSGAECVICMGERRDTLILPCRHLCLCSNCAESLRYQCSFCPICRSAFRALLQLRAMRRKPLIPQPQQGGEGEENPVSQEGVPPGYEAMSLIEALNGPCGGAPYPPPENHVPRFVPSFDTETTALEKRKTNKKHTSPGHKRRHKAVTDDNLEHSDDKSKDKPDEDNKRVEVVDSLRSPEEDNKRNNIILVRYPSYKGSPTSPKIPSGEEADGEETENCMEDGFEAKDIPILAESPRRIRSSKDSNSREEFLKLYEVVEEEVANETPETSKVEIPKPDYDEAIPVTAVKRVLETVERIERASSGFSRPVDEFGKLASGISSGHMADDELEDTTDGEPERDSDFEGQAVKDCPIDPDLICACDDTEETDYAPQSQETTVDGYQPLQITTANAMLSENAGNNTETSGASSAGSSQNLLPHTLTDIDLDDDK